MTAWLSGHILDALAGLPSEPTDKPFEFVVIHIGEAAALDIQEPNASRFAQSFQLGDVKGIALLDQPQAVAQNLTGVLIAA
jgi:hypothetical protein